MSRLFCLLLSVIFMAGHVLAASPESVYKRTINASVSIWGTSLEFPDYHRPIGSGFVVFAPDLVGTCWHVLNEETNLSIRLLNYPKQIDVSIVYKNKTLDIALLKMVALPPDFRVKPLKLDLGRVTIGEKVYTIGGPRKQEFSFVEGIVSQLRTGQPKGNRIQTTLPVSPGNSGGPVFNKNGKLIGIIAEYMPHAENTSFIIPAEYLSILRQYAISSQ